MKHNFPFKLLADETCEVVGKYEVKSWIPNKSARAVVVIDENGKIAYHKVESLSMFRPSDEDVLQAIAKAS